MNQKFFEIKYINERKHSRVNNMKLTITAKIRETSTRFLQLVHSECFYGKLSLRMGWNFQELLTESVGPVHFS